MIIDIILFLAFIAAMVSVTALLIAIIQGAFDKNESKQVISPTHQPLSRISPKTKPSLQEVKEKTLLSEANADEVQKAIKSVISHHHLSLYRYQE